MTHITENEEKYGPGHQSLIFPCGCMDGHYIEIEWQDDDSEWRYLTLSHQGGRPGIRGRLKDVWAALWAKNVWNDIILNDQTIRSFRKFFEQEARLEGEVDPTERIAQLEQALYERNATLAALHQEMLLIRGQLPMKDGPLIGIEIPAEPVAGITDEETDEFLEAMNKPSRVGSVLRTAVEKLGDATAIPVEGPEGGYFGGIPGDPQQAKEQIETVLQASREARQAATTENDVKMRAEADGNTGGEAVPEVPGGEASQ